MAALRNPKGAAGLAAQIRQARAQVLTYWKALGDRERLALQAVAALLGVVLAWSLLLAPALRTLKTAPAELEKLDLQLQQMQAQAQEVHALRSAPAVPPAQAQAALTASVEHLGPAAHMNLAGERAVVTLTGIAPEALQAWLGEVRSAARARPVEAQLTRGPKGYSGSLVLTLGGA
ncbi:type II secretion system protein GspM [Roseateles saccharophilus]|uniref:General secretion pathway protein M n=1 Tax=Roseateles saccharophilus TaxID=304 RepID=A0A4R3UJY0_ROSSA|nr:type II secretion system protein GspM [Roseateles saccharophilus]MDG0834062.1 type II secretion system protein M [Roseateles saccharophilus]TCU90791.1 general secretion pathway protein M [Roseateles saccharophilus]